VRPAGNYGAILRQANDDLRTALRSMISRLEPHLEESQLERLREFERRPPRPGAGGPPPPPKR